MFIIIRILVLLLIFLCFCFIQKKKGPFVYKRTKKTIIIRIAVSLLIMVIVFIPYESPFIRFNSAEESIKYSTTKYGVPIRTVETDKTAFCVGHKSNNFFYYIVTKYNDKYGFCDRNCYTKLGIINTYLDEGSFKGNYRVTKLSDNETNEKCYIISLLSVDQNETEEINIFDKNNDPIEKMTFPDNRTVFALVVNRIDEKTSFTFNGKTYELD